MSYKISYRLFTGFLSLVLLSLPWVTSPQTDDLIPIDSIAAVVNNTIITKSDIDRSRLFFPYFPQSRESDSRFRQRILKDLIDYRVIYLEYGKDYQLNEEDYERVQIPVIQKFGSLDNLTQILEKFGMDWDDFKDYIREKVLYEKVILEKFRVSIPIGYQEIKTFYENSYVTYQQESNLPVKPLLEMADTIENYLRNEKISGQLNAWLAQIRNSYRIENKLERPGDLSRKSYD